MQRANKQTNTQATIGDGMVGRKKGSHKSCILSIIVTSAAVINHCLIRPSTKQVNKHANNHCFIFITTKQRSKQTYHNLEGKEGKTCILLIIIIQLTQLSLLYLYQNEQTKKNKPSTLSVMLASTLSAVLQLDYVNSVHNLCLNLPSANTQTKHCQQ